MPTRAISSFDRMSSPTSILPAADGRLVTPSEPVPDQRDDIFEDQEGGVGDDDHDLVLAVNQPQHAALEHETEHQPDRHRHQQHEKETAGIRPAALDVDADRGRRAVRAEGIERAMVTLSIFITPKIRLRPTATRNR